MTQDGNSANMVLLVFALFVPFFALMWFSITGLISRFGWSGLAGHFAASSDPSPTADKYRGQSLRIGQGLMGPSYGSCINVWIEQTAIYLQPTLMFRFLHPMLQIRWNQISLIEEQQSFFAKAAKITFVAGAPPLLLRGGSAKALVEKWQAMKPASAR